MAENRNPHFSTMCLTTTSKIIRPEVNNVNNNGKSQQPQQRAPPWAQDNQRIDVNLIAMLLWQALLTGSAVCVSHLGWYLADAGPGEMGLQYGLIAFGFLCTAMVLFHVGGIRDSLAIRAELSQEHRIDKWQRTQMRLSQRRNQKQQYYAQSGNQHSQVFGGEMLHPWQQPQQENNVDTTPEQNNTDNE